MIQQETELEVADNSGAKRVKCFKVLRWIKASLCPCRRYYRLLCARCHPEGSVKKGDVVKVVIVRTKSYIKRNGWHKNAI